MVDVWDDLSILAGLEEFKVTLPFGILTEKAEEDSICNSGLTCTIASSDSDDVFVEIKFFLAEAFEVRHG
jgi:hypothetical protein